MVWTKKQFPVISMAFIFDDIETYGNWCWQSFQVQYPRQQSIHLARSKLLSF